MHCGVPEFREFPPSKGDSFILGRSSTRIASFTQLGKIGEGGGDFFFLFLFYSTFYVPGGPKEWDGTLGFYPNVVLVEFPGEDYGFLPILMCGTDDC